MHPTPLLLHFAEERPSASAIAQAAGFDMATIERHRFPRWRAQTAAARNPARAGGAVAHVGSPERKAGGVAAGCPHGANTGRGSHHTGRALFGLYAPGHGLSNRAKW
jgi:hypothetical protein